LVVDGTNILVRAQRASSRREISYEGIRTGPLLIFVNVLTSQIKLLKPDSVVICFDEQRSLRRQALVASYKKNRERHRPESEQSEGMLAREFLTLAGVPWVEMAGYEADELIGAYWQRRPEKFFILSGDKDYLQLCDDGVVLRSPDRRSWDRAEVVHEMGIAPEHLSKAKALAGDPKDGVPGLPGVGIKTAVKLLKAVGWDLEALLVEPELAPAAQSIRDALECISLRDIEIDVPGFVRFDPVVPGKPGFEKLEAFLQEGGFRSWIRSLQHGIFWRDAQISLMSLTTVDKLRVQAPHA
jgi:5'-3' exonuclease